MPWIFQERSHALVHPMIKHFEVNQVFQVPVRTVTIMNLQVFVMVYADGPTRVLCFSDEPTGQFVEAEQSVLDLSARLRQAMHHYWSSACLTCL